MLLGIRELSKSEGISAVNQYLDSLSEYSNIELAEKTDQYQDISNIGNIHMKSILLNKFFVMDHQKIEYVFECRNMIEDMNIDYFDMVRILSITLDNAIEAVRSQVNGKVRVMIFQAEFGLNIDISNTDSSSSKSITDLRKSGITTKKDHAGLGLSIIDDIIRKYNNLFVAYERKRGAFTVHITVDQSVRG